MKVWFDQNGEVKGLKRHFELEGDQVVVHDEAELKIPEPFAINPLAVGFDLVEAKPTHIVSQWWNGDTASWLSQCFVGIPLLGMMNENKGAEVCTGLCGRYTNTRNFSSFFNEPGLTTFLKELNHNGFVTFTFSENNVIGLQTGIPFWGIYAVLEGLRGKKISEWWSKPSRLYETWTGALLVSRFPYPSVQRTEKVSLSGIEAEAHLWMLGGELFRDTWTTTNTEVCVVTGADWDKGGVYEAGRNIRRVVEKLRFDGIQYRTDLAEQTRLGWAGLREKGIV